MFNICGSGSFGHEDENERYTSPCSTPKRSRKNTNLCRIGKDISSSSNKNPYSNRGLDKFYALLAELDGKKQRIYTQVGSDEISFVRFVYPDGSDQVKPIVVKNKEKNQERIGQGFVKKQRVVDPVTNPAVPVVRLENLRHPYYYYFPLVLVMILLFLAVYGRSFAILCTSIGWYLIPTVNGGNSSASSSTRLLRRKKELARKLSEQNRVDKGGSSSPRSVLDGVSADKSPRGQEIGRRRSF